LLKLLFLGKHDNHYFADDSYYEIDPVYSSSTLIQTNNRNILVDTGFYSVTDLLLQKLKENNLEPEDITDIITTHYHLDHAANNVLFKNAIKYNPSGMSFPDGRTRIYLDKSKRTSPPGIQIIQTEGHVYSHCSVIYKWAGKTYVCCGDAFRHDWWDKDQPFHAENFEKAIKSLRKIFEIADVIIPGHDKILEGKDLEIMKKIVEKKLKEWEH